MTRRTAPAILAVLAAPAFAQAVRQGPITVSQYRSRAMVSAGSPTIRDGGAQADRLGRRIDA